MLPASKLFKAVGSIIATSAAAFSLVSCSSDSSTSTETSAAAASVSVEVDSALHDMLPQEIKDSGTIKVGTEAFYPPYEYLAEDGNTVVGLDPDLFQAVVDRLGVSYTMENIAFDSLLPSLDSKRFDTVVGAMTDNAERQANYDFVDYFSAGQSIVVTKDNPNNITDFPDLCGKTVSVLTSSAQETFLKELNSTTCKDSPIDILALQTDNDALLQVQNGRAVGVVSQDPVAQYNAKNVGGGNQFKVANAEPAAMQPLGYVFRKGDTELQKAIQASLQSLMDDGTYEEILQSHDVATGALTEATINGGGK